MSRTIDNRVVEMEFDNARFEKNVSQSLSTLDRLKAALSFKGTADNFNVVEQSVINLGKSFSMLEEIGVGALRRFGGSIESWAVNTVKSLSGVNNAIAGFGKFGEMTKAVGMLKAQGYALEEINEQNAMMLWFADETSYSFTDMTKAVSAFTAAGAELDEASQAAMGISLWAATQGQNAQTAANAYIQLGQAMGSWIKSQDWMSVKNANMDTRQFRQTALDTAVALGKLRKNVDGTYSSLMSNAKEAQNFTIDTFVDSLTRGAWFDKDVQLAVYGKYASAVKQIYEYIDEHGGTVAQAMAALGDQLDEFGKMAFLEGQQARTWQDVIEATQDASASAWMLVIQDLIGDYESTVKFFTEAANRFYGLFVQPIYTIEEVFKAWSTGEHGKDFLNTASNIISAMENLVWVFRHVWDKIVYGTTDKDTIFGIRLDYLNRVTGAIESFTNKVADTIKNSIVFRRYLRGFLTVFDLAWQGISGFYRAVKDTFSGVGTVFKDIIEKLSYVFRSFYYFGKNTKKNDTFYKIFSTALLPLKNLKDSLVNLYNDLMPKLTERWEKLKAQFKEKLEDPFNRLKESLKGLGDIALNFWSSLFSSDSGTSAADKIFETWDKVKGVFYEITGMEPGTFIDHVAEKIGKLSSKIEGFQNWLTTKDVETGLTGLETIKTKLENFKQSIKNILGPMWEDIKGGLKSAFAWIHENWDDIWSTIKDVGSAIWGFLSGFWDGISSLFSKEETENGTSGLDGIIETFKNFGSVLGTILGAITAALKPLSDGLKKTFENMSLEGLGEAAGGGGLALIGAAIFKFAKDLKKSNILIGLNEILQGFGDVLDSFAHSLDAKALKDVAIAVAILVGALFILISLPTDDLATAAVVLAAFLASMTESLKKLSDISSSMKINGKGFSWDKNSGGMMFMEVAIGLLVVAAAMRIIAKIPTDDLYTALFVIVIIVAVMTMAIKAISKLYANKGDSSVNKFWSGNTTQMSNNSIIKMGGPAATILAFALMMGVVALAVKGIAGMIEHNLGSFIGALVVVGVLIAAIVLATKALGSVKYDKGQKGVTAMLIALSFSLVLIAGVLAGLTMLVDKYGGRKVTIAAGIIAGIVMIFALFAVAADKADTTKVKKLMGGLLVLAIAVGLMAGVVYLLASSGKDIVAAGLVVAGIAVLFAILIALANSKLIKSDTAKKLTKLSAALLVFGAAVAVMAGIMYTMAQLSWEEIAKGAVAILAITAAFAGLIFISSITGDAVVNLGKAFLMIGGSLALLAIGALAVVKALEILSGDTIDAAKLAQNVDNIIQNVLAKIPGWLAQIVSILLQTWASVKVGVIDAAIQTVMDIVNRLLENDTITKLVDGVSQVVIKACDAISANAGPVVNSVGGMILSIMQSLASWLDANAEACGAALRGLIDGVINIVLGLFAGFGDKIYDQTTGELEPKLNSFKGYIDGEWLPWVAMVAGAIISYFNPVLGILTAILGLFGAINNVQIKNAELAELGPLNDYYQKQYMAELDPRDPLYQQKRAEASQKAYNKALEMQGQGYGVEKGALVKYNKGPKGTVVVAGTQTESNKGVQIMNSWGAKATRVMADAVGNGLSSGDKIYLPTGNHTEVTQNIYTTPKESPNESYRKLNNLMNRVKS